VTNSVYNRQKDVKEFDVTQIDLLMDRKFDRQRRKDARARKRLIWESKDRRSRLEKERLRPLTFFHLLSQEKLDVVGSKEVIEVGMCLRPARTRTATAPFNHRKGVLN